MLSLVGLDAASSLMAAQPATVARVRRGLALMLGATAALVAMNACAKVLREDGFSTAEIIFFRTTPGLVWIWLELRHRRQSLRPVRRDLVLLRSGFGIGAMAANFYAVRLLTLAQNNVLHLLQPVFVAMFAPFVLRERLHRVVLVALVLAATGALLVLSPRGDLSAIPVVPALIGVSSAVSSALAHVTIRKTSATEAPEVVVFHFALHAALFGLLWGWLAGDFQLGGDRFALTTVLALAGTALFGTAGQLLMTRAYGQAPAALIAMVAYAGIPLSLGVDALGWGAPVGVANLAGAALMVAAGYLVARRPKPQPGQP